MMILLHTPPPEKALHKAQAAERPIPGLSKDSYPEEKISQLKNSLRRLDHVNKNEYMAEKRT